jgi:EAL domain-containing protein (putative c-di-GMP-specific phosphodiesterase class I)
MKVLCEGVETAEYDKYLADIGIDYIQGYYYDKPLPVDIFLEKYIKN